MATIQRPAGLHFVVSTDVEKANPEVRKLIRSHVMLGKNRGRTRVSRKRKATEGKDPSSLEHETSPADVSRHDQALGGSSAASATTPHSMLPLTVPRKFGSDLSSIRFADTVEPGRLEVVLHFSSIAKKVLFPLEACILFESPVEGWVAPISLDPAYLHALVVVSQGFFDTVLPQKLAPTDRQTLTHVVKALRFLRQRMARNDDQETLSNSTAAAVVNLAGYALMTGDSDTARHHMEGLCKIVNLRGGVAGFTSNRKLLVEILRCDISIALQNGTTPVIFNTTSSPDPFVPYPNLTSLFNLHKSAATSSRHDSAMSFDGIDDGLARAWTAISEFCTAINSAAVTRQRISMAILLETMASVMYRLLNVRFEASSSNEAIRLGLLAFSCTIFLPRSYPGSAHPHFTPEFKECLISMASHNISSPFLLWLLMVGAVSVFDVVGDEWLRSMLLINTNLCNVSSWKGMQNMLQPFMWVSMVHEQPGKRVFDFVVTSANY